MFGEEFESAAKAASSKYNMLKSNPAGYFMLSMLAGIYVGFGVLLVFTLSGALEGASYTRLVMGACFSVALSLVVIAGAELFTGNNFVMTAGMLRHKVSGVDAAKLWAVCWAGNFCGSVLLALIYNFTGLYSGATLAAMTDSAAVKMNAGFMPLLARGMLCNALVCLAVWSAYRSKSDPGKLIMIFWCILAFYATGFEHSVANMTLFTLALINNGGNDAIGVGGCFFNLIVVTAGNMIGGALLVALPYHIASKNSCN